MRERRRLLEEQKWVSLKSNWKIARVFVLRICFFLWVWKNHSVYCEKLCLWLWDFINICVRMAVIILIEALWLWVCVCETHSQNRQTLNTKTRVIFQLLFKETHSCSSLSFGMNLWQIQQTFYNIALNSKVHQVIHFLPFQKNFFLTYSICNLESC
jgi:hypothetical protein